MVALHQSIYGIHHLVFAADYYYYQFLLFLPNDHHLNSKCYYDPWIAYFACS